MVDPLNISFSTAFSWMKNNSALIQAMFCSRRDDMPLAEQELIKGHWHVYASLCLHFLRLSCWLHYSPSEGHRVRCRHHHCHYHVYIINHVGDHISYYMLMLDNFKFWSWTSTLTKLCFRYFSTVIYPFKQFSNKFPRETTNIAILKIKRSRSLLIPEI